MANTLRALKIQLTRANKEIEVFKKDHQDLLRRVSANNAELERLRHERAQVDALRATQAGEIKALKDVNQRLILELKVTK